jgi:signal transduction histidine kinase
MQPAASRRGRLSYKLLVWFLLISLVPVGIVVSHLVNISLDVLKEVSLRNQTDLAVRIGEIAEFKIQDSQKILRETARLGNFAEMNPDQQEKFILDVMRHYVEFLEISVVPPDGVETTRLDRFLRDGAEMRDRKEHPGFVNAMHKREYIGSIERIQGVRPALTMAIPIMHSEAEASTPTVRGVLMGKVTLTGISSLLNEEYPNPARQRAAIATPDGHLVAHSDPDRIYKREPTLSKPAYELVRRRISDTGGGTIASDGGTEVLGAYARIKTLDWIVYVQQPLDAAYRAATEMRKQVTRILLWLIVITVLLSLAIAAHITEPLRELTRASEQLRAGRFEDLPDMILTNDEIGDLGQSFLQMSDSLKEKTEELVGTNEELSKLSGTLARRVEARTRELRAAQEELVSKERLAIMGQMASVVGHEIRNPLAVINNSIFYIKTKLGKSDKLDQKLERHVSIIESEVKQAGSIISEILNYSRSRELKPEITSLNHYLHEILSVYPFPPHIKVSTHYDPSNPVVNIDQDEFRQAIRNLIGNGIEVMPESGTISIATGVVDKRWVQVDIGDTGPGIPQDVVDKIFTAFFTTKARGTGLGLAVVKKMVDRINGRVKVDSTVGKGTVFHLFIPLMRGAPLS